MKLLYLLLFTSYGIISDLQAQSSATATATATIVKITGAEKLSDLEFGTIYTQSEAGKLEFLANGRLSKSGGVVLMNPANETGLARIKLIGDGSAYNIMIQSEPVIYNRKDGRPFIEVDAFKIASVVKDPKQPFNEEIQIGARLILDNNIYNNTCTEGNPLSVIINYN